MNLLYIDLFCGAGGTSTGVEAARVNGEKCAKVVACVNHDAHAIASHAANHPDAMHFIEDVRTMDLKPIAERLRLARSFMPDAKVVLWASLECTNFSRAKGGKPRDPDSRTLAEHLFRYIEALRPDYLQIENVEEFMSWGDMDAQGKPVSKDKGRCYVRWCNRVMRYGYDFEHRILNAADYGSYTSRKRYFAIFARHGLPIVWPTPTHCRHGIDNGLFGSVPAWKPVRDVLDFNDKGKSIFGRKKPLSEKTLERIYEGLLKFVPEGKEAFLSKQYSGHPASKNISIDEPAGTITTKDHHAFIFIQYGNGYCRSCDMPASTITTKPKHSLVTCMYSWNAQVVINDTDSYMTKKIKSYMLLHNIIDILMRMFREAELKRIMGFSENYVLCGTQVERNKYIGNAVPVVMACAMCETLGGRLSELGLPNVQMSKRLYGNMAFCTNR